AEGSAGRRHRGEVARGGGVERIAEALPLTEWHVEMVGGDVLVHGCRWCTGEGCVMTEAEYLASADPGQLLGFLRGQPAGRKLRLWACACCRGVGHLLTDPRSRAAVEAAERYADGEAGDEQLRIAFAAADGALIDIGGPEWMDSYQPPSYYAAEAAALLAYGDPISASHGAAQAHASDTAGSGGITSEVAWTAVFTAHWHLLREILGNPFRPPPAVDPAWRTPAVLQLAQAAYDDRVLPAGMLNPDRLAVLADAAEEAGCTDAELLSHLRSPGPHVRGCWAVDAALGRS